MELFLLIAIGLSLISLVSVARTKTPHQTFSANHFLNKPAAEEPAEPASDEPVVLPLEAGSEPENRGEEELALQENIAVSQVG